MSQERAERRFPPSLPLVVVEPRPHWLRRLLRHRWALQHTCTRAPPRQAPARGRTAIPDLISQQPGDCDSATVSALPLPYPVPVGHWSSAEALELHPEAVRSHSSEISSPFPRPVRRPRRPAHCGQLYVASSRLDEWHKPWTAPSSERWTGCARATAAPGSAPTAARPARATMRATPPGSRTSATASRATWARRGSPSSTHSRPASPLVHLVLASSTCPSPTSSSPTRPSNARAPPSCGVVQAPHRRPATARAASRTPTGARSPSRARRPRPLLPAPTSTCPTRLRRTRPSLCARSSSTPPRPCTARSRSTTTPRRSTASGPTRLRSARSAATSATSS